jgi:hypothetical protein
MLRFIVMAHLEKEGPSWCIGRTWGNLKVQCKLRQSLMYWKYSRRHKIAASYFVTLLQFLERATIVNETRISLRWSTRTKLWAFFIISCCQNNSLQHWNQWFVNKYFPVDGFTLYFVFRYLQKKEGHNSKDKGSKDPSLHRYLSSILCP